MNARIQAAIEVLHAARQQWASGWLGKDWLGNRFFKELDLLIADVERVLCEDQMFDCTIGGTRRLYSATELRAMGLTGSTLPAHTPEQPKPPIAAPQPAKSRQPDRRTSRSGKSRTRRSIPRAK